ncbi:cytochrome c family protein [Candidatus Koribacter versatilis Ellin345]|uniref:Cytochrome c family protein n=1 Tax=Koribacter versatilis (strain Ellin345) TaxID=204669 RepID=Q1IUH3_KORVE|nr:cytochrome c3 family protein [Candidatus Koribacter versatilis]ABF39477.1 cytochrome c family protein [Candidatus Koribacter versatilis Ellin345]
MAPENPNGLRTNASIHHPEPGASEGGPRLPLPLVWFFGLLTLLLLLPLAAKAQISPGPLSQAHQDLSSSASCTKCHSVSPSSPNFRCLDCHRDIAARLQQKRGYHPALVGSQPGSSSCVKCHSEHNGANFALVKWDSKHFDHAKAGFELDGKHAALDCAQCHSAKNITPSERLTLSARNANDTYLGLSTACTTCHEDKHNGRQGANCQQCHDERSWSAASRIDHAKTRYPLTGAHAQVKCQSCHVPQADGKVKYVGLRFDGCESCHKDVHQGEFSNRACQSCHSTGGWKQTSFAREFDHSKTKFMLAGKHAEVACNACHRAGDFKAPIAHDLCADCHKLDPHNGQFAKRADGGKCESCHTVEGWKTSRFLAADHANTGFPLRGKHSSVDCAKCHVPAGKATLFKVKFALCTDCHKDAHQAQFAGAPYLNKCEKCHTEKSFHAPTFTLAEHQKSGFVLTGGHLAVACIECHKAAGDSQSVAYHFNRLTCATCHSDPHRGQFRARMERITEHGEAAGCEACHTTKRWNDLQRFDHSSTKFDLSGAHKAVECIGCHRPPAMERKLMNVDFQAAPTSCEQCHNDPHGSQFAHADRVTRCAECHDANRWRPSHFDHEKTLFSLKGAHQNTPCKGCHTQFREVANKQVLFYKPTPTKCASCHASSAIRAS